MALEASKVNARRQAGVEISIVSLPGHDIVTGRKRDEIKSYTVIAVFFSSGSRAYTSGALAPAISCPTPYSVTHPPISPPPPSSFSLSKRIPGQRRDATRAMRRFEKQKMEERKKERRKKKNVLQAYPSVLLVEEENNAFLATE